MGVGQLGPGFYVTQDRSVAEWFAREWDPGPEANILHIPILQNAFSELKIVRLTKDSLEYKRLTASWGGDIPSDLRYLIDDYDAIEAPIGFADQWSVQLKFNPRAQSFIDQYPFFFEKLP
ncbi:MAG: hypothetical protein CME32_18115 [Gimesia sp.]|nr:hypothetical protein [Gimesia sp.]